ncbi:MAG: hypothetical protein ACE5G3_03325 [Gammaproteobacteria bacterium]
MQNDRKKGHRGSGIGRRMAVVLALLLLAGLTGVQAEVRVGPIDPVNGYPLWYEDSTGLRLELCLDPALCFVPLPDPALPVSFPGNFPDEAFYWSADALLSGPADPAIGINQPSSAKFGMAREAAFAAGPVVPGDQVVFSRIRFFIDGYPGMVGNTYLITHPYGTETFVSTPGDAGPGVNGEGYSATIDVGLVVGDFAAATAVFPTFLIPAGLDRATLIASPGAVLDPGAGGIPVPVAGSPLGTDFFRIEGPNIGLIYSDSQCADATLGIGGPGGGGVKDPVTGLDVLTDCVETDLFALSGRVATIQGVDIEQALYGKGDADPDPVQVLPRSFVSVWARSSQNQSLEARMADGTAVPMTEGEGGHYFAQLVEETDYPLRPPGTINPGAVTVTNLSDVPISQKTALPVSQILLDHAQPPTWNGATGALEINLEISNAIDVIAGLQLQTVPAMTFTGSWASIAPGRVQGLFTITGSVPPRAITVTTGDGASVTGDVQVPATLP